jgi:hypothetical protein
LTYEAGALKVARDYRSNKVNSIENRFEVAHAMERFQIVRRTGETNWLKSHYEGEKMADNLRVEFGHLPQVYGNYLSVAQNANCDQGRDMARRILQMPAPAETKAAAQRIFDRSSLIGKQLELGLTTVDGKATKLSTLANGKRTVVVLWAGDRSPSGPPGLSKLTKAAAADTNWVYISLGAWTPPDPAAKGQKLAVRAYSAPPGTYCVEKAGLKSLVFESLKITQLPYAFVVDEKKYLSSYGRVDEIPALLAGINRLIEK